MTTTHIDALVTQEARRIMASTGAGIVFSGVKTTDGIPTGEPCLVVGVEQKRPLAEVAPDKVIPAAVQGVRTDVVELPRPTARPRLHCPRSYDIGCDRAIERHRPLVGGISMFQDRWPHWARQDAGTLGLIVRDSTDGTLVGLTNNHCMGMAHDPAYGRPWYSENTPSAVPVMQPAVWDAGSAVYDRIGVGKRAVPMAFHESTSLVDPPTSSEPNPGAILSYLGAPSNTVDGALIALDDGIEAGMGILEIHPGPFPFATPQEVTVGMVIYKAGRTTGRVPPDIGTISSLSVGSNTDFSRIHARLPGADVDAPTPYEETLGAHFINQMIFQATYTSDVVGLGGDSGSVVLGLIDGQFKVVGLYFAGVGDHSGLFHPIWEVAAALQIEPYDYVVGPAGTSTKWFFGMECAPVDAVEVPAEASPQGGPPPPAPVATPTGDVVIPVRHRPDSMEVYIHDYGNPSIGHITYGEETFRLKRWKEGNETRVYLASLVFEGVWIPQGATLQSAHLELLAPENGGTGIDVYVKALYVRPPNDTDARRPQSFAVWDDYDDSGVPIDYPLVRWLGSAPAGDGPWVSPDLTPMLQYLVNRPDWAPGGGIMLTLDWFGLGLPEGEQVFYGLGPSLAHHLAPRLHLVWG